MQLLKKNKKTAFVTFFPIYPNNMGSSTVVNSRFNSWLGKKKIFQISHLKKTKKRHIETITIKKESPINKIIKLPELTFRILNYLKKSDKKIVILEGASWIFYSFTLIIFLKLFSSNIKIIYISHGIESEIRKKYSNKIIFYLTYVLEYIVFRLASLSTSVSIKDKETIRKLYKKKTILFPNAITLQNFEKKRIIKEDYIIYTGSYLYKPNKEAIDNLNNYIMPYLIKKFPKIKLIITGGGYKKKHPWLIDMKLVSKKKLYNLLYNSICLCVPLLFGYGTRIKIIEALSIGATVLSTEKGIEGIKLYNKSFPIIAKKINKIPSILIKIIKNNKRFKKQSAKIKNFYVNEYSMKNILNKFIYENKI